MKLLSFIATIRDTFESLGTSEAAAVRVLANGWGGHARDIHLVQFFTVEFDFEGDF